MRVTRITSVLVALVAVPVILSMSVRAHCPLCSAGAGGVAGGASALGVGLEVVGVFIGAFAAATGFWTTKYISTQYVRNQEYLVAGGIYLSIVAPILPMMTEYTPIYLSMTGEYGSLLNRTYMLNDYLVGAILGGAITSVTPRISRTVSKIRGSTVPFQGLATTFLLLGVIAASLHTIL